MLIEMPKLGKTFEICYKFFFPFFFQMYCHCKSVMEIIFLQLHCYHWT